MDLWDLPNDNKTLTEYSYVIDIEDYFSKWIWSYTVKYKTALETLECLESYIIDFGKIKILHIDNGI